MSKLHKSLALVMALVMTVALLAGCGSSGNAGGGAAPAPAEVPEEGYTFPLAEKAEISGLTRFPANTESDPNNRTIYKRLEEKTNVHVNWKAIQGDQWGDKIALEMANIKTLPEFISPAGLGDADPLKYAKQGVIIPLEDYITPELMPNLTKVFEQAPEYKDMCTDYDFNADPGINSSDKLEFLECRSIFGPFISIDPQKRRLEPCTVRSSAISSARNMNSTTSRRRTSPSFHPAAPTLTTAS